MHILNQDKPEGEVDMDIIRGKVLDPVRQESQEESYMNSTEQKEEIQFFTNPKPVRASKSGFMSILRYQMLGTVLLVLLFLGIKLLFPNAFSFLVSFLTTELTA